MQTHLEKIDGLKVVVGISGGVDSAVAALLLKQHGAQVEALHMTNWEDDDGYCTAAEDLQDARQICASLDIPFHHVNFCEAYRQQVFAHFLSEYRAGRTPNPDVLCNREIKFGNFLGHARRLGADLIATGHYARVVDMGGRTVLYKGQDASKDQSYFLHSVHESAFEKTVFPLGALEKGEVRSLARQHGMQVHDKKDSTGICFIGERPFREFLSTWVDAEPGPIRTADNQEIGAHVGLPYYTLGQRQGLGIGGLRDASDEAWYVADKDVAANALIVVQGNHPFRYSDGLTAVSPHWINGMPPELSRGEPLECQLKVRYRQPDQPCRVEIADENQLTVSFAAPMLDVSPGQYAVFYQDDVCLGGAAIEARRQSAGPL